MGPHDAERRQSLGQLYILLRLFFPPGSERFSSLTDPGHTKCRKSLGNISFKRVNEMLSKLINLFSDVPNLEKKNIANHEIV